MDVADELAFANFVRNADPKIGGPAFKDRGVVNRSLKFADNARGCLLDHPPWPVEHETVDRVSKSVAWFELIVASVEVVLGRADPPGKRKKQGNAAAGWTFVAVVERRICP